jgi:general secretion pathway protein F
MQEFQYLALDNAGHRQEGSLRAANMDDAMHQLHSLQLHVVSVRAARPASASRTRADQKGLKPEAIVTLVDELATLLDAGVPLAEAVATLAQAHGEAHPLAQTLRSIRGGMPFSTALEQSGLQLPEFALQLVRSGEVTGKLGAALRSAASHLEAEAKFQQEARNALLYPMVLVGSGIVATLVMFIFVVPRFAAILDNPKADLPLMSQLVLGAGLWLTQHQLIVGTVLGGLTLVGIWAARRKEVRDGLWEVAASLPVLGAWTLHAELSRWASLLGVLLHSKVPLLTALTQANQTLRRRSLRAQAALALGDVRGGKALSQALAEHSLLDAAGLNLIRVGERAGSLPQTVTSLARIHTNQSQLRLKRFLVLLEPLTILAISVVLGGIMISVMLAITSLTNVL